MMDKVRRAIRRTTFAAGIATALCAGPTAAFAERIAIEIEGRFRPSVCRVDAYVDRGVVMLPVRPILDGVGISHIWNHRERALEVRTTDRRYKVYAESWSVYQDFGRVTTMSRPMTIRFGEPYVPLGFLETVLGRQAIYDRRAQVIAFGRGNPSYGYHGPGIGRRHDWDRDRRREIPLSLELPRYRTGGSVRIGGSWGGASVRVRLYRPDGREVINRTARTANDRWLVVLSLDGDEYRVVVEGIDHRGRQQRTEGRLRLR